MTNPESELKGKTDINGFDESVHGVKVIDITSVLNNKDADANESENVIDQLEKVDDQVSNEQNVQNMLTSFDKAYIWHAKLGHASIGYLKEFQKKYPDNKELRSVVFDERINDCEICAVSKINRLPFKSVRHRATKPLEIVHSDVMGPITPLAHPQGYKYIVTFTDDFSRVALAYAMRHKNETGEFLEMFIKTARNVLGYDAKFCYLRSDQGTEYTGGNTVDVLKVFGAESQLVPPDTPELNGVAERLNQTIQRKVRACMCDSQLPANMWHLALGATMYAYNRMPHRGIEMQIPLKKFAPDYSYDENQMKRFGCLAYMKIQRQKYTKFGNIGKRAVMVGYTRTGYILYRPEDCKFYTSRDVRFNEKLVYADRYSNVSKDISNEIVEFENPVELNKEEMSKTEGVVHEETTQKRKRGRPRKNVKTTLDTTELIEKRDDSSEKVIDNSRNNYVNVPEGDMCYVLLANRCDEPESYAEAMQSREHSKWSEAINNELLAMSDNQVWTLVNRPSVSASGRKPNVIDSRWVLKKKIDDSGNVKFKARLVVRGCKDSNSYEVPDTYAPVSRLTLVRGVFAVINKWNLDTYQLDVKTAFLNGEISEEIYMEIPDGMHCSSDVKEKKVCKLQKALYGLKISPKKWNEKFTQVAERIGLKSSEVEPCLFTWRENQKFLILLLYVDDMIMASNDKQKLMQIKISLMQEFEMTDLGEPSEFLGFKVERNRDKKILKLSQNKYIESMLDRFGFGDLKPQSTPMETKRVQETKRKEREDEYDAETLKSTQNRVNAPYREAVGSLLYLANASRPDILYAVNVLCRHQIEPTEYDWQMVKRVFRYVRGTSDHAITYRAKQENLEGYSDASWANCKGSLTTSGYVIRLYGDSIGWRTRKQNYVALSTCEAEYVAMSDLCQELVGFDASLKLIINKSSAPMIVWCDNMSAKSNAMTCGGNKLRHVVEIKENYVKDCVKRKAVEIKWVSSKDQLADIFTKALPFNQHRALANKILNRE